MTTATCGVAYCVDIETASKGKKMENPESNSYVTKVQKNIDCDYITMATPDAKFFFTNL